MGSRRGGAGIPHSWEKTSVRAAKQAGRLNVNLSLLLCYISFCLEKHEVIQKNIYSLNKGGGLTLKAYRARRGGGELCTQMAAGLRLTGFLVCGPV